MPNRKAPPPAAPRAKDKVKVALSPKNLARLRGAYNEAELDNDLKQGLIGVYHRTTDYANAIEKSFFFHETRKKRHDGGLGRKDADLLTPRERELCLITLLTAQNRQSDLDLHIYLGLMAGLSPVNIVNAMFLTGVYGGVPSLADGLETLLGTLGKLDARVRETPAKENTTKHRTVTEQGETPTGPHPLSATSIYNLLRG